MIYNISYTMDHKNLLKSLWFSLKDNAIWVYFKKYQNNYILEVDFENEKFNYWDKIKSESKTTQNFSQSENWVVFECVDRLLEKWYNPEDITLEKVFPTGHWTSWRLDILVQKDWKSFLMIECKTWWKEYEKELNNMQKNGWQLFTYFQQDRDTEYLMLYASNEHLEFRNDIVKVEEHYKETTSVVDFYDRWNKLTKQNWIFEDWINAYNFESRALTKKDLKPIKQEDASIIFNSFLEILRKNTVSDKPNAFNKIFTLFLCKIYDEWDKRDDEELAFQWIEWKDNHIDFQLKLTDLYKKWMQKLLEKEVTDLSNEEFNNKFWWLSEEVRNELLKEFNKIRLEKNNEFAIKDVFDKETFEENAIVLKEVVELLQTYQIRYEEKQPFLWDFFELLLTTWLKQEAGQFFTPVPVAKFICKSIPINKIIKEKLEKWDSKDLLPSVIDYAAWSWHFLTESMEEIQSVLKNIPKDNLKPDVSKKVKSWDWNFDWTYDYMYWIEKDYRLVKTAKVWCFLHGDGIANVIHWDWLDSFEKSKKYRGLLKKFTQDDNKENAQFDLVLSNPPYSVWAFKSNLKEYAKDDFELFSKLTEQSSEIEALFIERTSQLLKEWWIAWIILPSSILSNTWIYTKAREIILKDFEIIAITELGSNTFMATWTNTVTFFLRKRNKYFAKNLEISVNKFFTSLQDVTLNWIDKAVWKYVNEVWEWLKFEDYISLILKNPNENIKNNEIFKDYQNKIKLIKKSEEDKQKEFFEKIIKLEKEKLFYFVLTYSQKLVLVKSWEKNIEKEFLGYKFSEAKWNSWIHPIYWWKKIDDCTKLFDPNSLNNPEKASTYIYDSFLNNHNREVSEELKNHIFRMNLSNLLTFDRVDFEKTISLNLKKKNRIESKWEIKKLWEICEVKIWWTPSRANYEYWENWDKLWVSISEMNWQKIFDTKENINDLWVKKSNVKLIKSWTTLLSFKLSIWKTAIAWEDLFTNEAIAWLCLDSEEKVLNKYLFNLFNSRFIDLEKWNFNAFWKSLNSTFLKEEVLVPLPPKDIQEQIVDEIEILEKVEEKNLEKIWELEKSIEELIWSVNWEKQIKIWEIAEELFAGWDVPEWNYIKWLKETEEYNVPIYSNWLENDWLYWFTNRARVEKPCVTISARWTIWFPIERKLSFYPIVRLLVLIPKEDLALNKYLVYVIKKLDLKQFWATTPQLTVPQISDFKISLPPLETQKQIVSEIEKLEKEIEILKDENSKIPEKKKEILKKYL